jgi:hypothetical protein
MPMKETMKAFLMQTQIRSQIRSQMQAKINFNCMTGITRNLPMPLALATLFAATLSLAACSTPPKKHTDSVVIKDEVQYALDKEFVREPFNDQTRLGVIRQRSLYEVHFKPESAKLSNLGQRDVAILAEALRSEGGRISVPKGIASDTLYAARIEQVRLALVEAGIDMANVKIGDEDAGGIGSSTYQALLIQADIRNSPMKQSGGKTLNNTGDGTPSSGGNP